MMKKQDSLSSAYAYHSEYGSADLLSFLKSPEQYIEKNKLKVIKRDKKTSLFLVAFNENQFVVKTYNVKSFWYFLTHCFRKTRALKSWQGANLLIRSGLLTPKPIAFLEKNILGLKKSSYFVMEHQPGQQLQALRAKDIDEPLIDQISNIFKKLATLRVSHGDLKATNFIVNNTKVYLLDLDAMHQHKGKKRWAKHYKKDVARFLRNWEAQPSLLHLFKRKLG